MTEDGEMAEEGPEVRAAEPQGPTEDDVDGEVDRFLGQVDDPEDIRARGEAETEPEDAEYEARMNERYEDQIEHEKEMLRQGGIDVDGTGEGMPLGSTPIAGPRYRPREVVEAVAGARAEEAGADAGGASEAGAADAEALMGPAPGGAVSPAGAGFQRPGQPEQPGHGEAVVVRLDEAGQALLRNFMEVQSTTVVQWTEAIAREVKELKESVPRFATGDLKLLAAEVGKLAEYLRVEQADETRRREASEASESRWTRPLRVAAVVAVVGAFAAGAGLQARWPVLEDGTNGWKDIVWQRHGIAIAECIKRASGRDRGEVCSVSANIR